jgi:hypothetical protein
MIGAHPVPAQFGSILPFNPRDTMQKPDKIDYAKLLGFDAVGDHVSDGVDFQDETISARLGAKVGNETQKPVKVIETAAK